MNCKGCNEGNHDKCLNYVSADGVKREEPTKTWCACQHKVGKVHLDPQFCRHYKLVRDDAVSGGSNMQLRWCPDCGASRRLIEQRREAEAAAQMAPTGGDEE